MTKINWDEAPDGAQRYLDSSRIKGWMKKDKFGAFWIYIGSYWNLCVSSVEELFDKATSRPTEHVPLFNTEQGEL